MASNRILPAASATLSDGRGLATPQFYRFFQSLALLDSDSANQSDIAAINAELAAIQAEIAALPKGSGNPTLQALAPLYLDGLLQNGFAMLRWGGTTSDVPEGSNLYYTDARVQAAVGRTVFPFAFGDASPVVVYTAPNNRVAVMARIVITTPFNGTGAALKVGTAISPELLMAASDNDATTAASYESSPDIGLNTGDVVQLTIAPGAGATQGAGQLIIEAFEG